MSSIPVHNQSVMFPHCSVQKLYAANYYKVIEGLAARCDQKDSYEEHMVVKNILEVNLDIAFG
jgi:hypothetical protein